MNYIRGTRRLDAFLAYFGVISHNMRKGPEKSRMKSLYKLSPCRDYYKSKDDRTRRAILTIKLTTRYQSRFNAFSNFVTMSEYLILGITQIKSVLWIIYTYTHTHTHTHTHKHTHTHIYIYIYIPVVLLSIDIFIQ